MAIYYFLPNVNGSALSTSSPTREIYDLVQQDDYFGNLLNGYNEMRHVARKEQVIPVGRDGSLADLEPGDRLYVFGHGDLGGQLIRTRWIGGEPVGPEQLADLLAAAHLTDHPGHNVKLFACNSGVRHDGRTFAQRVATALHARGYRNLLVSGYVGVVTLNDGAHKRVHKRFSNDGAQLSTGKTAHHRRVTYDTGGWIVAGREGRATTQGGFTRVRNR